MSCCGPRGATPSSGFRCIVEVSGWLAAAADTMLPVPARLSSVLAAGEGAVGWEGAADVGATLSNNVTVR